MKNILLPLCLCVFVVQTAFSQTPWLSWDEPPATLNGSAVNEGAVQYNICYSTASNGTWTVYASVPIGTSNCAVANLPNLTWVAMQTCVVTNGVFGFSAFSPPIWFDTNSLPKPFTNHIQLPPHPRGFYWGP